MNETPPSTRRFAFPHPFSTRTGASRRSPVSREKTTMTTTANASGRDAATRLTVAMLWLLIGVFVLYPLCRLLAMTFWGESGFTLENLKPFVSS